MKKIVLTTLAAILILGVNLSFANTQNFIDVNTSHWAKSYIDSLKSSGIISGYPDGTFKPSANVKINEFIAMTVKALGYYYESPADDWAKPYIDKAYNLRIIEAGQFEFYTKEINRQQMASIVVNAVALTDFRPSTEDDEYIRNEIKDFNAICDYYKQNALDSYKLGMTSGYPDGTFRPLNFSTRAEAATLISKLIDPSLRVAPNYEFKTTVKEWFWVQGSKDNDWWWSMIDYSHASTPGKLKFADDLYKNSELQLVDNEFKMPVYKGINVHELYEFGKFVNKLMQNTELKTFYNFSAGDGGFGINGYADKTTYTDIFKNNIYALDQSGVLAEKSDFIFSINANDYAKFPYVLRIEKKAFDRQKVMIEKMLSFLFVKDTEKVMNAITDAFYSKNYLHKELNANTRNISVASGDVAIIVEFSIKH